MSTPYRSARKIRLEIAQLAAKIIAVDGVADYLAAKRKAAMQLGLKPDRFMPTNIEVEQAVAEYQNLFQSEVQPLTLNELRGVAVEAMTLLADFRPRLVGPVLSGTATAHSEITLHVYCDVPEDIILLLNEHGIPAIPAERSIRVRGEGPREFPAYRFIAGRTPIVLVIFTHRQRSITPLSPIDGKRMRRARLPEVQALLRESAAGEQPDPGSG